MSKLRLDIEALEVESFDTAEKKGGRGTVHGASETLEAGCSFDGPCTGSTFPAGACQSAPDRYCPDTGG
ncbi:MAG TPA: hypothetical protein VFX98_17145 [Longimicrobiaceae bacterium]|nr:hypothetical protein [Longimicrobiaceae bacterium]